MIPLRRLALALLLALALVGGASALGGSWASSAPISVESPPTVDGFPARVTVAYLDGMQPDFDDLRFTAGSTDLPYWIEAKTDSTEATVRVRLPINCAALTMYYGNNSAASESNGNAVFEFFDDFSGVSLNASKWSADLASGSGSVTVSNGVLTVSTLGTSGTRVRAIKSTSTFTRPYVYEYRANIGGATNAISAVAVYTPANTEVTASAQMLSGIYSYSSGGYTNEANGVSYDNLAKTIGVNSYHRFKGVRDSSGYIDLYYDGTILKNNHAIAYTSAGILRVAAWTVGSNTNTLVDWILVRKYLATEPVLTVGPPNAGTPVAAFTANATAGLAPLSVQFTDTSTGGPTSWAWSFGDGNTSTDQDPQHTYTAPGLYTVTLNATNEYGSDDEIRTDYITVYGPITAQFTANVTHTFDLSVYKGQSFFIRLEAEHPDFGTINRDYAVAFKGVRVPLGPLPDGLYIYVAGFGLMLLGGIFGATSATRGVVVIAFAGWLFWGFGWLDDLGLIAPASLGLVSTIAVMGVIVTRYREEGYT